MTTRVLIVDDNRDLAEDLGEILRDEGYACTVMTDSRIAAAEAASLEFDVALVDMRMPGLDGVALHRVLLESHPDALYLLMTAFSTDDRVQQALAAGAKVVLPKPLPLDRLLSTLPSPHGELLIVEDDANLADNLSEALRDSGYETHVAYTLEQAQSAVSPKIDAAVVDFKLPDGSGVALARELFESFGIPVILISGYDPAAELQAEGSPRVRLLAKPFAPTELLDALHALREAAS